MRTSLRQKKRRRAVPDWLVEFHLRVVNRWIGLGADYANLHLLAHINDPTMRDWSVKSRDRGRDLFWLASEVIRRGKAGSFLEEAFNRVLLAYPAYPALIINEGQPLLAYVPVDSPYPRGEVEAVNSMLLLAQIGALPSLKFCPVCDRLFKPIRSNQRHCSGQCSKSAYDKSPKERARRRQAAREYYDRNGRGGRKILLKEAKPRRKAT